MLQAITEHIHAIYRDRLGNSRKGDRGGIGLLLFTFTVAADTAIGLPAYLSVTHTDGEPTLFAHAS